MDKQNSIGIDNFELGKKIIETAVNIDEALAELLKIEVRRIKKIISGDTSIVLDELERTNTLVKNIIIALTITDERIRTGLQFCSKKGHE